MLHHDHVNYYLELVKNLVKKYWFELILIFIALLLALGSFAFFLNSPTLTVEKIPLQKQSESSEEKKFMVEIAGAVNEPGIYQLSTGARLNDLLKLAQGLSDQADKLYFARNFNLARYVQDQEKVYIPSKQEITQGQFNQNGQAIGTNSPTLPTEATGKQSEKVDLNSASLEELDSLPGVGQVTAQKIIDNRPYQKIDDLLSKKIVKQNVFDTIKEKVSIN
jgi:competence protein ComEA